MFMGIKAILKEFKKRQNAESQKSLVYSQNETDTCKIWIDGKKIYRKVIQVPAIAKKAEYRSDLSNLNASTYIQIYGFVQIRENYFIPLLNSDEASVVLNIFVMIKDNVLRLLTGESIEILNGFVVLEYTKTTN